MKDINDTMQRLRIGNPLGNVVYAPSHEPYLSVDLMHELLRHFKGWA